MLRSEHQGADAGNEFDRLLGVVEFGKDLFVGHGREISEQKGKFSSRWGVKLYGSR
jgi:hypothetical protein